MLLVERHRLLRDALAAAAGHGITTEDLKAAIQAEYQAAGRSSYGNEFNY